MIGMLVAVDEVLDRLPRHLRNGFEIVRPQRRGSIYGDYSV